MIPRAPYIGTLCPMMPVCLVHHVDDYSVVDREALKRYYHDSFSHITCKPLIDDKHNRVTSHNKTTLFLLSMVYFCVITLYASVNL